MPDQSYRTFLKNLEQQGEMIRFTKEVDPLVNMAAVEWKAYNQLGKSSLFTNIKGHAHWRACSQILADRGKWSIGLGIEEDAMLETMSARLRRPVACVAVAEDAAPVKEIKLLGGDADLRDIPAMMTSEKDGGRFLASGMAIIKDPETGIRNVSIHRQQIMDRDKTGFLMLHRQARRIYDMYCARGEAMPVAMVYGVHPAIFFGSAYTTRFGVGRVRAVRRPARRGRAHGQVRDRRYRGAGGGRAGDRGRGAAQPRRARGAVRRGPRHLCPAGPCRDLQGQGDHPPARPDPLCHPLRLPVTDTQQTTALGIEIATQEHLRNVEGGLDLRDVRCVTAAGLMMLVLKLRPRVEGQAKTALMAALSGPYLHPKIAIAVDEDIDAADLRQVMWSMTTRVHAEKDVTLLPNTRVFPLDNISPIVEGMDSLHRIGTKWLIDATMPAPTQVEARARFERAIPKNFDSVDLDAFLP